MEKQSFPLWKAAYLQPRSCLRNPEAVPLVFPAGKLLGGKEYFPPRNKVVEIVVEVLIPQPSVFLGNRKLTTSLS